jgi:hypothetical protein
MRGKGGAILDSDLLAKAALQARPDAKGQMSPVLSPDRNTQGSQMYLFGDWDVQHGQGKAGWYGEENCRYMQPVWRYARVNQSLVDVGAGAERRSDRSTAG